MLILQEEEKYIMQPDKYLRLSLLLLVVGITSTTDETRREEQLWIFPN